MMHSVLAAHGNLVVADKELSIREEVVVHPPCVVKSADADCFSAALNQDSFALPIVPPKCAKFMATVLLHDEAKANLKLVRNIQSCCPKGHVVASVSCKQHATSNCLKYSTEQLNLASGAFCVVKALHDSKAEDCMQVYIRQRLSNARVVGPEWQPNAEDTRFAELLLEKTFYRSDLHMRIAHDAQTPEELAALDRKRREHGAELRRFFPGNWRSGGQIVIRPPPGQFLQPDGQLSLDRIVERGLELMNGIVNCNIELPALNKWTALDLCFSKLLRSCVFNFLPNALKRSAQSRSRNDDGALSDGSSDAQHGGLPQNESAHMLRVQQWRRNKAAAFMASHLVKALLTIWICVSEPCMQIHYKLFKEGQRKHKPNCDNMDLLCDLLDPSRSLVGKILDIYVGMLSSSHTLYRDGWALLYAMEGERWRPEVCAKARASLMSIIGNVWRRLSHYFQQWPWLLIALVSPRGTSATRMRIAKRFMDTPLCCMDAASRQLRALVKDWKEVLQPGFLNFAKHLFTRIILSTQFIECLFAQFRQWLASTTKPLSIWGLARKHVTRQFMRRYQDTMGQRLDPARTQRARTKRARPAWISTRSTRGRKSKASTVFIGEYKQQARRRAKAAGAPVPTEAEFLKAGSAAWKALPLTRRLVYKNRARRARMTAVSTDPLADMLATLVDVEASTGPSSGPWNIGDAVFPLAADTVAEVIDERVHIASEAFIKKFGTTMCKHIDSAAVKPDRPCLQTYGACRNDLAEGTTEFLDKICTDLRMVLSALQKGKKKFERSLPILLLTVNESLGFVVQTFSYRLSRPLEAEFVIVDLPVPIPACPFPCTLEIASCSELLTEMDVARRCFRMCPVDAWCFTVLVDKFESGHAMIEKTVVTEIKSIDLVSVRAEELAVRKANAEARNALKALALSRDLQAGKRRRNPEVD